MVYFAPSPEFAKYYKTDGKFKETLARNTRKLTAEEITVDQYINRNDRALREAKTRAKQ